MPARILIVSVAILVTLFKTCGTQNSAASPFTADISVLAPVLPAPELKGKLFVNGNHLRADWGQMADVFDLKTRKGWRVFPDSKSYQELGSKDLSTYAPEMENGSLCPHAEFPSSCKLVGIEQIEGRQAKKWDLYNPSKGFSVYFWTDAAQGVTLRMEIGDAATYRVTNIQTTSIPQSRFEVPAGYNQVPRSFKPPGSDTLPQ